MNRSEALEYACLACDTMMSRYSAKELPPEHKFHYHQGVFLSGMMNTYKVCGSEKYYNYVKEWVDSIIWEDGSIHDYDPGMLDDIQPGILLFPLYEKSGDERYKKALDTLLGVLKNWIRNSFGGFWHKNWHQNQMWLDGLYMAGPLEAEYAKKFDKPEFLETAVEQTFIMAEHMSDEKTGPLYHGWDEEKKEWWADPETGISKEFWGRAMGWYAVAILDILKFMPEEHKRYKDMVALEKRCLEGIIKFQDEKSGMWFQVMDKGNLPDNWLETSCSALFAYAVSRGVKEKIIDEKYMENAWEAFFGIIKNSTEVKDGRLNIGGICIGTDVSNYEAYVTRPVCSNDLHGMGAFLLMCASLAEKRLKV